MIPANYSIYSIIFFLFFIISCNGQNKKNIRESNLIKSGKGFNQPLIFPNLPSSASKIGEYLREIHQDKNGNLWFGTLARGVARFDGKELLYFTKKDGLVGNQINGIVEDKKGNLWFATTEGVSKYDGKTFSNFTTKNGLSDNSTWSILADSNGNIWVSTIEGVSLFNGKTFSDFKLPNTKIKNPTSVISTNLVWEIIEDSKGNIWFGTDGIGVFKYDGEKFTQLTKEDGLNTNDVASILEDSQGNFWFGCFETRVLKEGTKYQYVPSNDGGLSRYDGKVFTKFPKIQGLIAKDIGPIYEDKSGNIWVASKHNALYRYDGGDSFTNFREEQGIAKFNCVQSILEDNKGNLWVGFSGGLFRLDGETLTHISVDGPWD